MMTAIGGLGLLAALHARKEGDQVKTDVPMYGVLTDARKAAFESAMHETKRPEWYRKVADGFETFGLPVQAKLLRARADSRTASKETLEQRKEAIRTLLKSRDAAFVLKGADACEKLGMTIAAGKLRIYAQALKDAAAVSK
jgi:hypothetical protein